MACKCNLHSFACRMMLSNGGIGGGGGGDCLPTMSATTLYALVGVTLCNLYWWFIVNRSLVATRPTVYFSINTLFLYSVYQLCFFMDFHSNSLL